MYDKNITLANSLTKELKDLPFFDIIDTLMSLTVRNNEHGKIAYFDEDALLLGQCLLPLAKATSSKNDDDFSKSILKMIGTYSVPQVLEILDICIKYSLSVGYRLKTTKSLYDFYIILECQNEALTQH
jgi:hypothetical protein